MCASRTTLLLLVWLVATAIDASALVMCAKVKQSTGEVRERTPIRLRTACKPKEVEIDPVALDLQGPPGTNGEPGADGTDGQDGLSCWDTNLNLLCDAGEDLAEPFGCGVEDCHAQHVDMSACGVVLPTSFSQTGHEACGARVCITQHRWFSNSGGLTENGFADCSENGFTNRRTVLCCG